MEIWKDIKGYEGYYQISNLGQVRSVDRTLKYRWHNISEIHRHKGQLRSPYIGKGYWQILLWKNNKQKRFSIHRLIAEAFISNPNNYTCINHKNGVKTDNRIENLEWCTLSYNAKHAWINGLVNNDYKGDKNPAAKLTNTQVKEIKQKIKKGIGCRVKDFIRKYGISRDTYFNIKSGKQWASVKI